VAKKTSNNKHTFGTPAAPSSCPSPSPQDPMTVSQTWASSLSFLPFKVLPSTESLRSEMTDTSVGHFSAYNRSLLTLFPKFGPLEYLFGHCSHFRSLLTHCRSLLTHCRSLLTHCRSLLTHMHTYHAPHALIQSPAPHKVVNVDSTRLPYPMHPVLHTERDTQTRRHTHTHIHTLMTAASTARRPSDARSF